MRNAISLGTRINLIILATAWFTGAARWAQHWLIEREGHEFPIRLWAILPPAFVASAIVLASVQWMTTPRSGRRLSRMIEHVAIAFVGGSFLLICQTLMPKFWLIPVIAMMFAAVILNRILFGTRMNFIAAVWLSLGVIAADFLLPASSASAQTTPLYLMWLAMIITIWHAILPRRDPRLAWWLCGSEPQMDADDAD